jgi:glycosyltransferase involved in cell wall biosynthesis
LQRQKRISSQTVRFIHAANSHISLHHSLLTEEHRRYNMPQSLTSVLSVKKIKAEYKTTDYIRAQSKWVQQTLLENGVPAEKVFYVPPAVDLERYRPAAQLPENFTACFVGSFDLRKGVQYLLPAWTKTSPAIPQATLIMHGGAGSRWMNRFLTPYREFPGINWVGGGSADPTYAKSSVCVVPSIEDGFCYVVLEAMASGLPVIVSEHVGAKELVVEGVNGFVVPIRDSAAIAERLLWFYRNPEKLQIMGGAARATAEKYSYTMEGQRLSKAFEERLA